MFVLHWFSLHDEIKSNKNNFCHFSTHFVWLESNQECFPDFHWLCSCFLFLFTLIAIQRSICAACFHTASQMRTETHIWRNHPQHFFELCKATKQGVYLQLCSFGSIARCYNFTEQILTDLWELWFQAMIHRAKLWKITCSFIIHRHGGPRQMCLFAVCVLNMEL